MSNEQAAPETKGVTVKLLAALDLGPEIEGMAGRQLRMRLVTFAEPNGDRRNMEESLKRCQGRKSPLLHPA